MSSLQQHRITPKGPAKGAQPPSPKERNELDPGSLYNSHHILHPHYSEYSVLFLSYAPNLGSLVTEHKINLEGSGQHLKNIVSFFHNIWCSACLEDFFLPSQLLNSHRRKLTSANTFSKASVGEVWFSTSGFSLESPWIRYICRKKKSGVPLPLLVQFFSHYFVQKVKLFKCSVFQRLTWLCYWEIYQCVQGESFVGTADLFCKQFS